MVILRKKRKGNSLIVLFICTLVFLSCATTKDGKENKVSTNCNCKSSINSYVILSYRYENNDTLIGPNTEWNDGTFDENENIDNLKKCLNLDINYTSTRHTIKGWYIIQKKHLVFCEEQLKKECKKEWNNIDKYKSRFKNEVYIKNENLKVDTIEKKE